MGKYRFTATHGVHLSEDGTDGAAWAHFQRDPSLDSARGDRGYSFETDDASVARRLRKLDDYGITDVSKEPVGDEETPLVLDLPAGNAPKAAWVDYAAAHGFTREEAEGLSVKELREHFAAQRPVEQETPGQPLTPSQPRPTTQND